MSDSSESKEQPAAQLSPLRIWPALVVVVLIWGLRIAGGSSDEMSFPVVIARFLAPLLLCGVLVLWWAFFSRASVKEKVLGTLALVGIAGGTAMVSHPSMQGFGTFIFAIPWGVSAFAVALIVVGRWRSTARTVVALAAALAVFGYWAMVRTDEILGDFETVHNWRWQPTAEDEFMETLASRGVASQSESLDEDQLAPAEWPAFRGADRRGELPGVVLEEDWVKHQPEEVWRIRLGPGWSSFSVAGHRLFTQEQRGDNEAVVCYDARDGSQLWVHEDESRFWEVIGGAGPRATPTIADGKLYTLGANGLLNRLDAVTGQKEWQQDIREDADRDPPQWGFSSSPLVTNGLVIVHAGGEDDKGMLAYDQASGELRWSAAAGNDSYSSPQLSSVDGKDCVLMLTNTGVVFVDPADGSPLGEHEWLFNGYRVVQPLVIDASSVMLGSGMGTGTMRADVTWDGDRFSIEDRWTSIRMSPYFNDYVAHKGYLYGFDNNIFACMDLQDGERKWKRGRYGNGQVVLLPDGDQLLVTTEKGKLVLLRATPDKLVELGEHQVLDGRTWNHPVLIGDRLYVRNAEEAACYKLKVKQMPPTS